MYAEVVITLFDLEREAFLGDRIKQIIKLTKERNKKLQQCKLSGGYYFQTHGSRNDLIIKTQNILKALELTDDLHLIMKNTSEN